MIRTYLKTAIRNLVRHGKHTILNVVGMGIAVAACLIVFLVVRHETSYEKHLDGYEQIHQVVIQYKDGDGEHFEVGTPFPAISFLRKDFSSYAFAELMQNYNVQVTALGSDGAPIPGKKFLEQSGTFFAEPELARMFELDFLEGSADLLQEVGNTVISESMAIKYFGDPASAMGKRIRYNDNKHSFQVAGIFRDLPQATDFPFEIITSYEGFKAYNKDMANWPLDDWGGTSSNHQVYVKLPLGTKLDQFERQLAGLEKKYRSDTRDGFRSYLLHPLKNHHHDERFPNNGDHLTTWRSLFTLAFIGLLVMLMAIINFVNLSTALASTRSREMGIRKVMGGTEHQIRAQVFMEITIVVLAALLLGLALAYLALPHIKDFMVVQTRLTLWTGGTAGFLALLLVFVVLLSGIYPALVMGRFQPVEAMKSKGGTMRLAGVSLRRVLVVMQFAFSQIFIVATVISVSQMNFIRNADLGFNQASVLLVPINPAGFEKFKNELEKRADVVAVSFSYDAPSSGDSWETNFAFDNMEDRDFATRIKFADHQYAKVYGLQMAAGSFYGPGDTAGAYVVNETFLKKCGVTDPTAAIGKLVRAGGGKPKPIVGVVKDFKVASLREQVPPIVMAPRTIYHSVAGIKLSSSNLGRSMEEIRSVWDRLFPDYVFDARFLDEGIQRFYEGEERLTRMYKVYALLAILISCLGLYGLISFMVVRRAREVSVRKVLGAQVGHILLLFSKEFTLLVLIAFLIAAPAAWYLMSQWLQDFAFRIKPGAGVFLGAVSLSLLIAWITVGYKALRTAQSSPVKWLRSE